MMKNSTRFSDVNDTSSLLHDALNFSCAPDKDSKMDSLDPIFMTYYLGLFGLIALVNLTGNFVILRTIRRHRSLWVPGNIFICSLATSDLLFGIAYPIYNVSGINTPAIKAVFGDWTVCRIVLMLNVAVEICSAYALVGITVTRYIYVAFPLRCHKYVTTRRNVIAVTFLWVASFIISGALYAGQVPHAVTSGKYCRVCRFEYVYTVTEMSIFTIMQFALPFAFMLIFYARMVCIARKLGKRSVAQNICTNDIWNLQSRGRIVGRQRRSRVLVTLLIGCFVLSYVPVLLFCFLIMGGVKFSVTAKEYFSATVRIFLFMNTAVNVFIYAGRMDDFRFYVKKDLQWLKSRCRRDTSPPTSHTNDVMVVSTVLCVSMRSLQPREQLC